MPGVGSRQSGWSEILCLPKLCNLQKCDSGPSSQFFSPWPCRFLECLLCPDAFSLAPCSAKATCFRVLSGFCVFILARSGWSASLCHSWGCFLGRRQRRAPPYVCVLLPGSPAWCRWWSSIWEVLVHILCPASLFVASRLVGTWLFHHGWRQRFPATIFH